MRKPFSPSRNKVMQEISARQEQVDRRMPINRSADYNKYFCHYNNAVYMGGMSAYKKHGKGILLHDDGSAVITDYLHDSPTGHNVVFRQNSIASIFYKTNVQFQVAYKQGKYIVTIPFSDSTFKAHGVGVLVDYVDFKIYRLVFKRGTLVEKILHLDKRDNEDVFSKNTATKIIGVKHQQAFSLNFQKPNRVHIKQEANKSTIGYFDQDGEMHGLGFSFYGENIRTTGEKSLYLKFIEKGYYRDSRIQTFGQKLFSNGNKYIGQFDKGEFHGYGILISPSEMKWVYGKFIRGQLNEIIDSNYKKFTEHEFQVWAQSLRAIHQRYKQRWIDLDIELPQQNYLYKTLKIAVESPVTYIDPDKKEIIRNDEDRLNRIQKQFQKEQPGNMHNSFVQKEFDRHYVSQPRGSSKSPEYDEQYDRPYTPMSKFQAVTPRKKQLGDSQHYYREQDPFKLNLTKVPFDSQPEVYIGPAIRKSRIESRPIDRANTQRLNYQRLPYREESPIEDPVLRTTSREKYRPYFYEPYDYGYRNKDTFHNYIDSVYNSAYYEELSRQRGRLNRIQDDQLYYNRLRRGLETSPIHRNYYTSPPKYEEMYPQRYVGRLTNRRNFNYELNQNTRLAPYSNKYQTSSKYYPNDEAIYQSTRVSPPSLYDSEGRKRNQSPEDSYISRKKTQSPQQSQQNRKNFIKNNYQYWNSKN